MPPRNRSEEIEREREQSRATIDEEGEASGWVDGLL